MYQLLLLVILVVTWVVTQDNRKLHGLAVEQMKSLPKSCRAIYLFSQLINLLYIILVTVILPVLDRYIAYDLFPTIFILSDIMSIHIVINAIIVYIHNRMYRSVVF